MIPKEITKKPTTLVTIPPGERKVVQVPGARVPSKITNTGAHPIHVVDETYRPRALSGRSKVRTSGPGTPISGLSR